MRAKKKFNENYLFLACPRIFFITIFRTIFDEQEYNNAEKFFSKKRKVKRDKYKRFLVKFLEILNTKYKINAFIGFNFEFKQEIELALHVRN